MKNVGIDINTQKSKEITEEMIRSSEPMVNMGCMDKSFCPTLFLPKIIEWNLEDPKGKSIEEVREIRDEIEKRVKELVAEIVILLLKDILDKNQKIFFAEIIGTLLASLFVKYSGGNEANLRANIPNYSYPLPLIFGIEVLASALLMIVIYIVAYTKGLRGFGEIVIGSIVGLHIFSWNLFLAIQLILLVLWHLLLSLVIMLIYGFILLHHLLELQFWDYY